MAVGLIGSFGCFGRSSRHPAVSVVYRMSLQVLIIDDWGCCFRFGSSDQSWFSAGVSHAMALAETLGPPLLEHLFAPVEWLAAIGILSGSEWTYWRLSDWLTVSQKALCLRPGHSAFWTEPKKAKFALCSARLTFVWTE